MSMHLTECRTVWPLRQTTTLRQGMVSTLYKRILSELFVSGVCLEARDRVINTTWYKTAIVLSVIPACLKI